MNMFRSFFANVRRFIWLSNTITEDFHTRGSNLPHFSSSPQQPKINQKWRQVKDFMVPQRIILAIMPILTPGTVQKNRVKLEKDKH